MNLLLKLLLKLQRSKRLSQENRALILSSLLQSINALPIDSVITFNIEGKILVNNKQLEVEQAIRLRQAARSLKDNSFYKLIKEQIAYEAIKMGVHSSVTMDGILMSKSALWIQQQEINLLTKVVGNEVDEDLE